MKLVTICFSFIAVNASLPSTLNCESRTYNIAEIYKTHNTHSTLYTASTPFHYHQLSRVLERFLCYCYRIPYLLNTFLRSSKLWNEYERNSIYQDPKRVSKSRGRSKLICYFERVTTINLFLYKILIAVIVISLSSYSLYKRLKSSFVKQLWVHFFYYFPYANFYVAQTRLTWFVSLCIS
jgi:hypothetical protein